MLLKRTGKVAKYVRVVPRRKLRNRFKTHKYLTLHQAHAEIQRIERLPAKSEKKYLATMTFFVNHFCEGSLKKFILKFGLNKNVHLNANQLLERLEGLPAGKQKIALKELDELALAAGKDLEKTKRQIQKLTFSTRNLVEFGEEAGQVRHFLIDIVSALSIELYTIHYLLNPHINE